MTGSILLLEDQVAAPSAPKTTRRFTVWSGSTISRQHQTVDDLAAATYNLLPPGVWGEVELLLKAGEGGDWQNAFDSHPLAPSGPFSLTQVVAQGHALGLKITPYVVVRGRREWMALEQHMIQECVYAAGRCVLNVEPGAPYWNGPSAREATDPGFIRGYLMGCNVPAETLEVCLIPRYTQVAELGGRDCIAAWTDPSLVGSASWECYGIEAGISGPTSLLVNEAIPRLDGWGVPPGPQYRIPVVQRDERNRWARTPWCAHAMQVWFLDGS